MEDLPRDKDNHNNHHDNNDNYHHHNNNNNKPSLEFMLQWVYLFPKLS